MHVNAFKLVYVTKITSNNVVSELFALNFIINYFKFRPYLNKIYASNFYNNFCNFS